MLKIHNREQGQPVLLSFIPHAPVHISLSLWFRPLGRGLPWTSCLFRATLLLQWLPVTTQTSQKSWHLRENANLTAGISGKMPTSQHSWSLRAGGDMTMARLYLGGWNPGRSHILLHCPPFGNPTGHLVWESQKEGSVVPEFGAWEGRRGGRGLVAGTGWDLPHNGWANSIYVKAKHLLLREPGPGIHGCRTAQEGSWAFQHRVLLEWNGAISQKRSP